MQRRVIKSIGLGRPCNSAVGRTSDLTPTFPRAVHDRLGDLKGRLWKFV